MYALFLTEFCLPPILRERTVLLRIFVILIILHIELPHPPLPVPPRFLKLIFFLAHINPNILSAAVALWVIAVSVPPLPKGEGVAARFYFPELKPHLC